MLPGEDGLSLCRELRARSRVPVVMLTILGEETDRILGLEMGADDYVPKPFNPRELLARVRAVLRRSQGSGTPARAAPTALRFAGWRLDRGLRRLESPDDLVVDLTGGEFDLLAAFAEHSLQVLTRDQLLDLTQGRAEAPFERSIDMQVSRLRRKIEADPREPELIKTVRGGGYVFTAIVIEDETARTGHHRHAHAAGANRRPDGVAHCQRGPLIAIIVDDDGPGIPDELREEAFKPFRRLESSRSTETGGTGLGLTIARTIIRAHGGNITLTNQIDGGLRAEVQLPR